MCGHKSESNGSESIRRRHGIGQRLGMLVGPQASLSGGDTGAVQFRDAELPSLDQFQCLPMALFCAGKHPLGMSAATVWRKFGHGNRD
jgi:hypothetical protein